MTTTKKAKIGIEAGRVSVYWLNHGFYSAETFATLVQAVAYAKAKGPSAVFEQGGKILGQWDAIGGTRLEVAS